LGNDNASGGWMRRSSYLLLYMRLDEEVLRVSELLAYDDEVSELSYVR
jgi:hypothetical protein